MVRLMVLNGNTGSERLQGIPREWDAFCEFVEGNYHVIHTVALAHVRDLEVAEEIAQDVCVRLLLEKEKLPTMSNPSGWLARVARNTACDWVRRRQTHSRILTMMESWNENPTMSGTKPEDARQKASNGEDTERLYAALDQLNAEDREIVLMHFMDGMEKQEIGRLLEVHPSTVGRRMDKALRTMRKSMRDFQPTALSALRPTKGARRGVIATLGAVAALGTSEQAALAAVAAPLPVFSVGAATTGFVSTSTFTTKAATTISHSMSGWGVSTGIGIAIVAIVVAATQPSFLFPKTTLSLSAESSELNIAHRRNASGNKNLASLKPGRSRHHSVSPSMMHGFSSDSARVSYLPVGARNAAALTGTINDEKGKPIAGAKVTAWSQNEPTSITLTTDAGGRYAYDKFPDGYTNVTVKAAGYADSTMGQYYVTLPLPVPIPLDISLQPANTMRGTVVDTDGNPVADAKVIVARELDREGKVYQGQLWRDLFVTHSDAYGRFEFHSLKPGSVTIVTEHPDYAADLSVPIKTDNDHARVVLGHGVTLVGECHDGKTTMSGAKVTVRGGAMSKRGFGRVETVTDENGRFVARNLPVPGKKDWDYSVVVKNDDGATMPRYLLVLQKGQSSKTLNMNTNDKRAKQEYGRVTVDLHDIGISSSDEDLKGTGIIAGNTLVSG